MLKAAVTGPEAGVPLLKQIHHKLFNLHIWRQFSVSSNALWQEIGSYKALSGRRNMHSPTHTGLETEFKAEPHSNETIVERVEPLHLPPEIFGSLQMCHLQIPEKPSVSSSSRGQTSQRRETLETQTCSVTQLSK